MATPATKVSETFSRRPHGYVEECLKLFAVWREQNNMPHNEDSLVEWDRTQNARQLLDWDEARCFQRGILLQARVILETYTRIRVVSEGRTITFPTVLKSGAVYVEVSDMSPAQIEAIVSSWQTAIIDRYIRIRKLVGKRKLQSSARQAIRRAEKQFSKMNTAAGKV